MKRKHRGALSWRGLAVPVLLSTATVFGTFALATTSHDGSQEVAEKKTDETTSQVPAASDLAVSAHRYPVTTVGSKRVAGIPTGEVDRLGNPVLANCTTCHATREANFSTNDGQQLKDFHQGLITQHGQLQCVSCHNSDDYSQLHLASGEALEFSDSIKLCAQCHGPQYRDYQHGAHGGMTGYWDLSRGPRTRNHCLVCHDAHSPQYQAVMPVFPPKDLRNRRGEEQPKGHAPEEPQKNKEHGEEKS